MNNRTIAAISTPLGPGGVGILRISGPQSLPILKKIFVPRNNKKKSTIRSHHIYYGHIREINAGRIIDEVLTFYMKSPNSYTREDVVEIQSHSGYVILDRLLSNIIDAGAELANPGEFTQRAFLNGRIDLSQAEAIIDLINAPCETAANIAINQASGGIKAKIKTLIDFVIELQGKCEAFIEFGESYQLEISNTLNEVHGAMENALLPQIIEMIRNQKANAVFFDGLLMTIAGVPNVGKSSLLNQLVEKEIAIVSEIPGTTRDVIREFYSINGIPVTLCDTAGLHDTNDPVECIGIDKAHDHIERSELLLFVVEATRPLNAFEEQFLEDKKNKRIIVILNKDDIADTEALNRIKQKIDAFNFITVSAKTGHGIADLKAMIFNTLISQTDDAIFSGVTPNLRQRKILEKIEKLMRMGGESGKNHLSVELFAENLGCIRRLFEEIIGTKTNEDIYDYIFKQFCVGK